MIDQDTLFKAYGVATVSALWITLSSFLLRMPLRIRWVNRTVGVMMLFFLLFSVVEIGNVKAVTPFIGIPLMLMGLAVAGIGFQVGWPNTLIMANNVLFGGIVAVITGVDSGRAIYYSDLLRSQEPVS